MLRAQLLSFSLCLSLSLLLVWAQGDQRSATSCRDEHMEEVNEEEEVRLSLLQNSFVVATTNYDQNLDLAPKSARGSTSPSTSLFASSPFSSLDEDEVAETESVLLLAQGQEEGEDEEQDNGGGGSDKTAEDPRTTSAVVALQPGASSSSAGWIASQARAEIGVGLAKPVHYPSRMYWHLPSNGTGTHALRLDAHGTWALHKQVTQDSSYVKCVKENDTQSCKTSVVTEDVPFLFGKRIQPLDLPRRKLHANISNMATTNPSLVMLPDQIQRMHQGGRYLGVMRADNGSHLLSFAILDSELCILEQGFVEFRDSVNDHDGGMTDPRLFWHGNQLMLAFSNFDYSHCNDFSKQFVAPLHLAVDGDTLSIFISGVEARVIEICDGELKGKGAKNLGFFTHNDVLHAVCWISPTHIGHFVVDANDGFADDGPSASVPLHRTCFRNVSMISNATVSDKPELLHNGPGLVYISSRDAFLGIGHRSLGKSPFYPIIVDTSKVVDIGDDMHSDGFLKWPHHYTMFFYTVEARPPFRLTHVGHEFCIGSEDCELIQFASSLTVDRGTVLLGYGVNDAESFVASISLTTILEMLHVV